MSAITTPLRHLLSRSAMRSGATAAAAAGFATTTTATERVAVYGSGLMGRGIAQVSAMAGYDVSLFDLKGEDLDKASKSMQTSIGKLLSKKYSKKPPADGTNVEALVASETAAIMGRVTLTTSATEAVSTADIAIEAIVENMAIKKELFQSLDTAAPSACLFLSNTSSLSITDMASAVSAERRPRFAGLHFFNPVPMMRLAEVVRAEETSEETFSKTEAFAKQCGKTTVACRDTPGFIVNRLLVPYLFQAMRLHEEGVATPRDIDTAMKLGAGYPMGPFELADFVGLDTCKKIMDAWCEDYPEVRDFKASPVLDELVAKGRLGVKSKAGFYDY